VPGSSSHPILYAHRGAAAERPENTLESFQRAIELGADALEMDLHLTSDGHIVVSHDPSAARMAGVEARFCDTTLADIKRWDAGYGFKGAGGERPFVDKGYRVPTLEEILVELPGVPINIDLKQPRPSMVAPVMELVRRLRAAERVTLASFQTRTILAVRRGGYQGATGLTPLEVLTLYLGHGGLGSRLWRRLWSTLGGVGMAVQIPTHVGPLRLDTRRFIDKCHELGMRVDFWTINEPDQARRLLAAGADGIMTDDPGIMKPVFDELRPAGVPD
jgi:glycerophosphoryl diester phosphodiesterase